MRYLMLFAGLMLLAAQHSWALYKCTGANGSVSFQDAPCGPSHTQTAIQPLVEAPSSAGPASGAPPATNAALAALQEQNKKSEAERLRFQATYALRDAIVALDNHRAWCEQQHKQIMATQRTPTVNVASTFSNNNQNYNAANMSNAQSVATELAALATRCDTRARQLEADVNQARRECAARNCPPPS